MGSVVLSEVRVNVFQVLYNEFDVHFKVFHHE